MKWVPVKTTVLPGAPLEGLKETRVGEGFFVASSVEAPLPPQPRERDKVSRQNPAMDLRTGLDMRLPSHGQRAARSPAGDRWLEAGAG